MDSARQLGVWLGVGAGHLALIVALCGEGGAGSAKDETGAPLAVVWVEPELASAFLSHTAPSAGLPVAASAVEAPPVVVVRSASASAAPTCVGTSEAAPDAVGAPPSFAERVEPAYPRGARLAGIQGSVRLRLEISSAGELRRVTVVSGSGDVSLDRAAVAAASASRYHPARVGGRAVDAVVDAGYRFELR